MVSRGQQRESAMQTGICPLPNSSHPGVAAYHSAELLTLCVVGPCWLPILNIAELLCWTPWLSLLPHSAPWQPEVCFVSYELVTNFMLCFHFYPVQSTFYISLIYFLYVPVLLRSILIGFQIFEDSPENFLSLISNLISIVVREHLLDSSSFSAY